MPIKFRCPHCRQFLGISRSKAGEIADCPMCGKSLRVPNLDGSVDPLPKPKLDLQDSSLVSALGELASIGDRADPGETIESKFDSGAHRAPPPLPRPEPVVLDPLVPAEPVAVAAPPPRRKQRRSSGTTAVAVADELELAIPHRVSRDRPPRERGVVDRVRSRMQATPRTWIPVAVIVSLFLVGGIVLLTLAAGRGSPEALSQDETVQETNPAPAPAAVGRGAQPSSAVMGRVTYVSEAGDTRPDDGAKVIALPDVRRGTVMFDAAGFLVGSDEVDAQVAAAALRALGGDLATADDKGEFALQLPQAGSYQLLVISRHQSRPWEVGVEADVQALLARFFLRPSTLLGQLAYRVQEFQYRGQGTSPRDFAFDRQ